MMCQKCKTIVPHDSVYCPICGEALSPVKQQDIDIGENIPMSESVNTIVTENRSRTNATYQTTTEEMNAALFEAFVTGKMQNFTYKSSYFRYVKLYKNINNTSSWNLAAFLFGPFFFLYRKLYKGLAQYAMFYCLLLAGWNIFGLVEEFGWKWTQTIVSVSTLVWGAAEADTVFFKRYEKKLADARQLYPNDFELQKQVMATYGGASIINIIIGFVVLFFMGIFLTFLFGSAY